MQILPLSRPEEYLCKHGFNYIPACILLINFSPEPFVHQAPGFNSLSLDLSITLQEAGWARRRLSVPMGSALGLSQESWVQSQPPAKHRVLEGLRTARHACPGSGGRSQPAEH